MQNKMKSLLAAFLLFMILFLPAAADPVMILTVWNAPEKKDGTLNFEAASHAVQHSRAGFELALQDHIGNLELAEIMIPEGTDQQALTSAIWEVNNFYDVLLSVGASSDEPTMYGAMAMNFFSIPLLIPFADGDLASSSGASYSFRMTPTSQNYANYFSRLFSNFLIEYINSYVFENTSVPDYSINFAIFYADVFNGNSVSVKVTQVLMDNGMNIDVYKGFKENQLLNTVTNAWKENDQAMRDVDVVIIIGEDNDEMPDLSKVLKIWDDLNLHPLFVLNGFSATQLDDRIKKAENLYMVQQHLDINGDSCPDVIDCRSEAMGYAAGYVMLEAIKDARDFQEPEPKGIRTWFMSETNKIRAHETYMETYRNNIRTSFMAFHEYVPCYGDIEFTNSENPKINFELVRYNDVDDYTVLDESVIFYKLVDRIRNKYFPGAN